MDSSSCTWHYSSTMHNSFHVETQTLPKLRRYFPFSYTASYIQICKCFAQANLPSINSDTMIYWYIAKRKRREATTWYQVPGSSLACSELVTRLVLEVQGTERLLCQLIDRCRCNCYCSSPWCIRFYVSYHNSAVELQPRRKRRFCCDLRFLCC